MAALSSSPMTSEIINSIRVKPRWLRGSCGKRFKMKCVGMVVLGNKLDDETHAFSRGGYRRAVGTGPVRVTVSWDDNRAGADCAAVPAPAQCMSFVVEFIP